MSRNISPLVCFYCGPFKNDSRLVQASLPRIISCPKHKRRAASDEPARQAALNPVIEPKKEE